MIIEAGEPKMQTLPIQILPAQDGGLVIYENTGDEQVLVFGGDLDATVDYLRGRLGKIIVARGGAVAKEPARPAAIHGVAGASTMLAARLESRRPVIADAFADEPTAA